MGETLTDLAKIYGVNVETNPAQRRVLADLVGGKHAVPSFTADASTYVRFVDDVVTNPVNSNLRHYIERVTDEVAKTMMSASQLKKLKSRGMAVYGKGVISLLFDMYRDGRIEDMSGRLYLMGADDMAKKGKKKEEKTEFVDMTVRARYWPGDRVIVTVPPYEEPKRHPDPKDWTPRENWDYLGKAYGLKDDVKAYIWDLFSSLGADDISGVNELNMYEKNDTAEEPDKRSCRRHQEVTWLGLSDYTKVKGGNWKVSPGSEKVDFGGTACVMVRNKTDKKLSLGRGKTKFTLTGKDVRGDVMTVEIVFDLDDTNCEIEPEHYRYKCGGACIFSELTDCVVDHVPENGLEIAVGVLVWDKRDFVFHACGKGDERQPNPRLESEQHFPECDFDEMHMWYMIAVPIDKKTADNMFDDDKVAPGLSTKEQKGQILYEYNLPDGTKTWVYIESVPGEWLVLDVEEKFELGIGDVVRIKAVPRATSEPYRKRFGVVASRETAERELTDAEQKEWRKAGRSFSRYGVHIDRECRTCYSVMDKTPDDKFVCVNPPCEEYNSPIDAVHDFWEYELEKLTTERVADLKARERKARPVGVREMPRPKVSDADKALLDELIAGPPADTSMLDVDLSPDVEAEVYLYRKVGRGQDYVLAGYYSRTFSGKGSDLINVLVKEHKENPFVGMKLPDGGMVDWLQVGFGIENVALVVYKGSSNQYELKADGAKPLLRDMERQLYTPIWKDSEGLFVVLRADFETKPISMFPLSDVAGLPINDNGLPFLVSDLPYIFKDKTGRTFTLWTKRIKYSAWLTAGGVGNPERDRGTVKLEPTVHRYAWICFDLSINDAEEKEYSLIFSVRNAKEFTVFGRNSNYLGEAYIPLDMVLLESNKSLIRKRQVPGDPVFFNVQIREFPDAAVGRGGNIKSLVISTDRGLLDTNKDGLLPGAVLPDRGVYKGNCYIMKDDVRSPGNVILKFSRITTDKEVYNAVRSPPMKDARRTISGNWDKLEVDGWGDKGMVESFTAKRGEFSKRPVFTWAGLGNVESASAIGSETVRGMGLDGVFKEDTVIYAKTFVVTGRTETGEERTFTFSVTRNPGPDQFDELLVRFGEGSLIEEAWFGRGGELLYTAKVGAKFPYKEPPYIVVKTIDYKALMTFVERETMEIASKEQAEANRIYAAIKAVDQDIPYEDRTVSMADIPGTDAVTEMVGWDVPNDVVDGWLGRPLGICPVPGEHLVSALGLGTDAFPYFDATVIFADDTRFRYVKDCYSVHFPIKATEAWVGLVRPKDADNKVFRFLAEVMNVCSLWVGGETYMEPKSRGHYFEVGKVWAPLGVKVVRIYISLKSPPVIVNGEVIPVAPEAPEKPELPEKKKRGGRKKKSAIHPAMVIPEEDPVPELIYQVRDFMVKTRLRNDWHEPDEAGVRAVIFGHDGPPSDIGVEVASTARGRKARLVVPLPHLLAAGGRRKIFKEGASGFPYEVMSEMVMFAEVMRAKGLKEDWSNADEFFTVTIHGDHMDNAFGTELDSGEYVIVLKDKSSGKAAFRMNLSTLFASIAADYELVK